MTAYPHLFSPIQIGAVTLPHRIMMGSMHTGLEFRPGGFERLAAFYGERARAGAGLIVTGGWSPDRAGRLFDHPGSLDTAEVAAAHRPVTEAVHQAGGRILVQLLHAGRYGYHGDIVAPSAIRSPINPNGPREMDQGDIEAVIAAFGNAARLSAEAGYDGVEVMGSEGYLITQFLASRTNQRHDKWGGSLENRARFAIEVVKAVRAALPNGKILMFRISALDLVEGGLEADEVLWLAGEVERAGADVLDTGIGWHEARVPTIAAPVPRAGFAWTVKRLRDAVTIPVIATNRINTPQVAERLLADGIADMVSLARPFLADPQFVAKARDGHAERINTCIACNQACLDHIYSGQVASCLVNPRACHESEIVIEPAPAPRSIAVVGAGPAGLAAAATAAERGHQVTLFEAAERIGGQFNLARNIPGKEEFDETLRYFANRIEETGVTLRLGQRATPRDVAEYDAVVVAAGITPRTSVIDGDERPEVVSYVDVLSGTAEVGRRVVIVGAGGIGFDVAIYLTHGASPTHLEASAFRRHWGIEEEAVPSFSGREITMLQRSPGGMGRTLGKTTGWIHRTELLQAGVKQISGVTYEKIDAAGLHIEVGGEKRLLPADTIVICAGQDERRDLADALAGSGVEVHLIGGANKAGELDAKRAIDEGVRLAAAL
jgi:2,4-dienoyl-CoA reductase (NADPH2)